MIIAVYSSHYLSFHSLRAFATFGKQRNLQISYLSASRLVTGLHDFQEQCQTVFHVMAFVLIFFKTMYDKTTIRFDVCDIRNNHNYNKIVKSDWLSTALISALIGQFKVIP